MYEFWWDEGGFDEGRRRLNDLRSLEALDDNVIVKTKKGVLAVEGEDDEKGVEFRVKREEEEEDKNIWLTSSEMVLKVAREGMEGRMESMAELPEKVRNRRAEEREKRRCDRMIWGNI